MLFRSCPTNGFEPAGTDCGSAGDGICDLQDEDPEWVREQLLEMVTRMTDAVFAPAEDEREAGADDC